MKLKRIQSTKRKSQGIFDKIIVNVMCSKSKKQLAVEQLDDNASIHTEDYPFNSDDEEDEDADVPSKLVRVYAFN